MPQVSAPRQTVLRVHVPMIAPIPANAGQLLVVSPGHPTHTLAVLTPDARRVVRHRFVEAPMLGDPIAGLCSTGVLAPLTSRD